MTHLVQHLTSMAMTCQDDAMTIQCIQNIAVPCKEIKDMLIYYS